jgi:hypothetical protein
MLLILPMAYDREKAQSTLPGFMSLTKNTSHNRRFAKSGLTANTKHQFSRKNFPEAFFPVLEIDYIDTPSVDITGYVLITLGQKTNKGYSHISETHKFNYAL